IGDLQADAVLLVRARDRGLRARAAVRHDCDGAAVDRVERGLLARGGAVGRPGAEDGRAGLYVLGAPRVRACKRTLLRSHPRDPRLPAALLAGDEPGDHPAEQRDLMLVEHETDEVRTTVAPRGAADEREMRRRV